MKSLTNVHGRNVAVYGFGAFQEDKKWGDFEKREKDFARTSMHEENCRGEDSEIDVSCMEKRSATSSVHIHDEGCYRCRSAGSRPPSCCRGFLLGENVTARSEVPSSSS